MSDDKKVRRGKTLPSDDKGSARSEKDLGHALRSIYSTTVNEQIPPELLDLLGKLD